MKIMVTGGAGFIGSNVVDGYIEDGHEVLVVDNLFSGRRENINPAARFYELDIRSREAAELIKKESPDVLNHHAAQISVPESVRDPVLDADINIKGFLNLLEAAVRHRVRKVIFISSGGAVYGEVSEFPTTETCPPRPLSPYAVAKYACEHYLAYYKSQYGLDYATLRYANIYGPRQIRQGEAGAIAIFMDNLVKGIVSTVNHYPNDEEGMVRDYCYVGDVVRANLLALDKGREEGDNTYNIGTGKGTKTLFLYRTIFELFKEMTGEPSERLETPRKGAARAGDLMRSCLDVGRARRLLGWVPQTELKEGIRKTLRWRLQQSH